MILTDLNIRSLFPNIDDNRVFLSHTPVACFFLSKTWLYSLLTDNLLMIPNYILFRHDRQTLRPDSNMVVKKGGGPAVYIKEDIHVDVSVLSHINRIDEDIEMQC